MSYRSLDSLDFNSWFDLWHTHPDWESRGNRYPEDRAIVAASTYQLLRYAEKLAVRSAREIQIFATVCCNTGDNAVYLHTNNPNGVAFPHVFPGLIWGVPLPPELNGVVEEETYEVGSESYEGKIEYTIRRRSA